MAHDSVKDAILKRMRETGEPYMVARRIIMEENREGEQGREMLEPTGYPQPREPRASTVAWQARVPFRSGHSR
jgi:hypothetical protein